MLLRRGFLLAALAGAGVLAAAWYFGNGGGETGAATEAASGNIAVYQRVDPGTAATERASRRRRATLSGLQTTIPDTLGYDERTAIYALEDGGFRVRVMYRKVSDSSQEGVVVQQLPRGNLTRRVGWIVTIVVGIIR
jgi:eukaryotic-like serine/threonine-protein kinase